MKINENTKVTLTLKQLKRLVKENKEESNLSEKVAIIELPQDELNRWDGLLDSDFNDFEEEGLEEDSTVFIKTATFDDGYEVDVKVCTGQDGEMWSEAVLFTPDGDEGACTEPGVALSDEWSLWCENGHYVVKVVGK